MSCIALQGLQPQLSLHSMWFPFCPDARSHTGMSMKMGNGAITSMSRKQKLNIRGSTEAKIAAVDDCMSQVPWTKCFLKEQCNATH